MAKLEQAERWLGRAAAVALAAGGVLTTLYVGFQWLEVQNEDVTKLEELHPEILLTVPSQIGQLSQQTSELQRRADEAELARRLEQERLKVLCKTPGADMPQGYCEGFKIDVRPSLRPSLQGEP